MEDFKFNIDNIVDGKLFVPNAYPGDFAVVDNFGRLCIPDQTLSTQNGVEGVLVNFEEFAPGKEYWTVNFLSSNKSASSKNEYSTNGTDWHEGFDSSSDLYMRIVSGDVATPPISIKSDASEARTYSGTEKYYELADYGNDCVNTIVNKMLVPQLWMFLNVQANYEVGLRQRDGSYRFSYDNWNRGFEPEVFLNGSDMQLSTAMYNVDYDKGIIKPKFDATTGDNLICTYNFSWFRPDLLAGFVERSIGTINYAGQSAVTNYTTSNLPVGFYGISADLCVAMAMENLILGYTMWVGRLIFAIAPNGLFDGNDNIMSQLELIKRNSEERAYKAIDNTKMRAADITLAPTPLYWRAVTLGNGVRLGPHGQMSYGKTRGQKYNKMTGMTGPDVLTPDLGV